MFAIVSPTLPSSAAALDLLVALSLKSTVLLALAGLLVVGLWRASAAARHLVWSAALLGVLALPILASWGPGWSVKGLALPTIEVLEATAPTAAAPGASRTPGPPDLATAPSAPVLPPESAPVADSVDEPARAAAPFLTWQAMVMTGWAMGAGLFLAWLLLGAWLLGRISRRARPVTDPQWLGLVAGCARQLGVRQPVRLWISDRVAVPCAWGVLRPRVLIPEIAEEWSMDRRRAVLLHELAHVARRDCLVQTLAQVACALLWFHPLVWLAAWRLRVEREIACDDLVLGAPTLATDYADHLLAVVRSLRERRLAAFGEVAFARRSQLEGRLLAVLDPDRPRGAMTAARAWRAALAAALVVVPLAAVRPGLEPANAGMTITDRGNSRPENSAASEVVRTPDSEVGLIQRLEWALAEGAQRGDGFWVAYEIPRVRDTSGNLCDSGPIDLQTLDNHWPGARVADVLAGRDRRDPRVAPNPGVMVMTFHYPARARRPESVDRIRIQSQELAADFGREPLFWLGRVDDRESLEWTRKLESGLKEPELRSAMLHAVGCHADDPTIRAHMVGVLQSGAPDEVRASAAERLARFTDAATVQLLVATLHDDPAEEVRGAAVQALGQMHSSASTQALSKIARDRSEPEDLRRQAIEGLGEKASVEAAQTLDELLATPEPSRKTKESERGKPSKRSIKGTTRITPRPGGQDIEVLDAQGHAEVTIQQREGKQKIQVREKLQTKEQEIQASQVEQEEIQRQAVESLGRFPEATSLPKLLKIARTHPNAAVRREAVSTLGQIDGPRAAAALLEFAWQDQDEEIARQAVDALHGRDGSVPKLIDLARRHKQTAVRRQAIGALGNEGPQPQVLAALDELVRDDPQEEVQREAVNAIGQMPEDASLPRLEKIARSHARVAVRRQAIDVLGNLDPEKAVPILESLIGQNGKDSR